MYKPSPPPDSAACVMQDFKLFIFNLQWFRVLGACFRVLGASFSSFGCFVFEIWVLRFRDLGASFSRFGCVVFEIWVLRASVSVLECFVFEATQPNSG